MSLPWTELGFHWLEDFARGASFAVGATIVLLLVRAWLAPRLIQVTLGRQDWRGLAAGASLGVVTPVCSCSVAPLYASLLAGGASQQSAAAFLFAAPAVNEIALAVVYTALGWKAAIAYLVAGFGAALLAGHFGRRAGLAPAVLADSHGEDLAHEIRTSLRRLKGLAIPLAISAAVASIFHVLAPRDWSWLATWGEHPLAPVAVTLLALPFDFSAAAAAPVVLPLAAAGLPMGTLLSLLMALTTASTPEGVLLSRIVGWRAVARLGLALTLYTASIGILFNFAR